MTARAPSPPVSRRGVLAGAGAAGLAATTSSRLAQAQSSGAHSSDHTIRIAPVSLEIAPGKVIKTTGYNGTVPGPVLRLQEGKPVAINVVNEFRLPQPDPLARAFRSIGSGWSRRRRFADHPARRLLALFVHAAAAGYALVSQPCHGHGRPDRSTYTGEFGFLIVEPAVGEPGRYDREVLLAARHWDGHWVSMQDIRKGPPPDNGLEAMYRAATLGDRMLGHGEPIRVRQGERVLFRLLNASASMGISLALPGHRFTVIALDGNPVPTPATVDNPEARRRRASGCHRGDEQSRRLDLGIDRRR